MNKLVIASALIVAFACLCKADIDEFGQERQLSAEAGLSHSEDDAERARIAAKHAKGARNSLHHSVGDEEYHNENNKLKFKNHHDINKQNKIDLSFKKHDIHQESNGVKLAFANKKALGARHHKDVAVDDEDYANKALTTAQARRHNTESNRLFGNQGLFSSHYDGVHRNGLFSGGLHGHEDYNDDYFF